MLQADYERGTKDSDILEAAEITDPVKEQLLQLGGPGSDMYKRHRVYLEVVRRGIMLLPERPRFNPVSLSLKNFRVEAFDIVDVVVSKLKRLNQNDMDDIGAMVRLRKAPRNPVIERFKSAIARMSISGYAEQIPQYIKNLNRVERDIYGSEETPIDLPDWMQE